MYLVEIISFLATSTLLSNWALINTAVGGLNSADGILEVYTGLQVNADNAFVAVVWDPECEDVHNQGAWTEFMSDLTTLKDSGSFTQYMAEDRVDPTTALNSPETEVTVASLKTGKFEADLEDVLDDMAAVFGSVTGAYAPFAWGNIVGGDYSIIAGWDSLTAHFTAASNPPLDALIPDLVATIDTTWCHVAFTQII